MIPDSSVLGGVPYEVARNFGMPHIRAYYKNRSVDSNAFETDAECAVCRSMATNSHHEPPKGMSGRYRSFTMNTPNGIFTLRPALIAICGSGTTGCHGALHDKQVGFRWVWDDEEVEERWWSGWFLSHGYMPHDQRLYLYGRWVITDKRTGAAFEYREVI